MPRSPPRWTRCARSSRPGTSSSASAIWRRRSETPPTRYGFRCVDRSASRIVYLEVLPGARTGSAGPAGARGQTALLAHLLELAAGGHLLSEQRGLNPVEQPFQPADQLRLGDPQLGVGRDGAFGERQGEAIEFFTEFRRQTLFEFPDAGRVDRAQPVTAGVVGRRSPPLFEELFDHGADS